jgi:geranylgeranyl pyrophosphate synthase
LESSLWKKKAVAPQEYFEVIQLKSAIAELHCKIGGIIGCADKKNLQQVARCGRVIGLLSTIKEEFTDLTNFLELQHRIKTELPPYPMLLALQNSVLNRQVAKIMSKGRIARKDLELVVSAVLNSVELSGLRAELKTMGEDELSSNLLLQNKESASELAILVKALSAEL